MNLDLTMPADWYKDFHFRLRRSWLTPPYKAEGFRTLGQDKTNRVSKEKVRKLSKAERVELYVNRYANGLDPLTGRPLS